MNEFEQFLREKHVRITEPRREVFSILNQKDRPLTISELLKLSVMSERTSVYRTLELFENLGVVQVIQLKGKQRYELVEPFKAHHHHLVCIQCGELTLIDTPKLEKIIQHIASSYKYEMAAHHVELQGICRSCRKAVK